MKFEVTVELTELEGRLSNLLIKKIDQANVEIIFCEEDMTDYIKVSGQGEIILIKKPMHEAFEMIEEALFDISVKLNIASYQPTEEGFVFELE